MSKIVFLIFIHISNSLIAFDISSSNYPDAASKYRGTTKSEEYFDSYASPDYLSKNNPTIIIYYGLNESHSRSWVQINNEGIVGITYFQRVEDSDDEGTLIYRTIHPDGSENLEEVATGTRLEKSVLLFDDDSSPNIFVATSNNSNQKIDHYYKNINGQWQGVTIINFYNEGGKFIYELSADKGPDGSFHLLILKSRSDVDSDDYMFAWLNSYLYHMTNSSGTWQKELVHNYDMAYTYDTYIKSSIRQDIKVDDEGYVHVTFGEQINAEDDPSRLRYATNKTGNWVIETALNFDHGIRDDAGWFPSLCLDNSGIPYISCMYVSRVYTRSARYCCLYLLHRTGSNVWHSEVIADGDDGYHGSDGRDYTGGLSHLVFDQQNRPHIIFSDIASSHDNYNYLNAGNIRYGTFNNGAWSFETIYRQPSPMSRLNATEMHGMCLLISDVTDIIRVIGQELVITGEYQYTSNFLNFAWEEVSPVSDEDIYSFKLCQNFPNPFNPETRISYSLKNSGFVTLKIYDSLGREIHTLVNEQKTAGFHSIPFNAGELSSGIYFYKITAGDEFTDTKKMVYLR
ncbi:T9SS type A sorting domain-containing protein [Bacteroidota bacterium]